MFFGVVMASLSATCLLIPNSTFYSLVLLIIIVLLPVLNSDDNGYCKSSNSLNGDGECDEKKDYFNSEDLLISSVQGLKLSPETLKKFQSWKELIDDAESRYYASMNNITFSADEYNCYIYLNVIRKDLVPFQSGITEEQVTQLTERGSLYQIFDGKLYRSRNCKFPARCSGIEHFLKKVAENMHNTEFVINTSDYPQIPRYSSKKLPLFSFSKTSEYDDIMYPAWAFWEGGPALGIYPTGLGRWDKLRNSLFLSSKKYSWEEKLSQAFFRGSRTSAERDSLILLSRKNPLLADAQYTKNQAWRSEKDTLGAEPATEIPLEDHCKYKYLVNFRGVAASFRFKHLFLCGSLVLHFGNEWKEFFYDSLVPWFHYIPVPASASPDDIRDIIIFARENDALMEKIAKRGFTFIRDHLKLKQIHCYWKNLLEMYSSLLKYTVKLRDDLILIS